MEKLTKSMSLFKERNCSVSIVLDSRTRRKNAYEFPSSLRFTIDRKFFYLTVGSSFTEKKFSDICNATKCKSENYKLQKEWKDTITPKYKDILTNLNKGGILTFEMVRQCIMGEGVVLFNEDTTKAQSFVSVWEQVIHELRTDDGGVFAQIIQKDTRNRCGQGILYQCRRNPEMERGDAQWSER